VVEPDRPRVDFTVAYRYHCGVREVRNGISLYTCCLGDFMDEIIVRVARALANRRRLQILSHLARLGEKTPSDLTQQLDVPINVLSGHLTKLATAGLIQRRRSGAHCYCAAKSPYSTQVLSGKMALSIRRILRAPADVLSDCGVREVRSLSPQEIDRRLFDVIFEAATAFTDLRRLQILRWLTVHERATADEFRDELKMSEFAVSRHISKLKRRGYVFADVSGRRHEYRLASKFKTPVHGQMWRIVREVWEERLRTSRSPQ